MSLIKTNDVTKFLKSTSNENLHSIVNECSVFPHDHGFLCETNMTFAYDGTHESLKSVVNTIGIEGNALRSAEFEWIKIVLKKIEECFDEYNLNALRGILIMKNEHAICFIKNTSKDQSVQSEQQYIQDVNHERSRNTQMRYMRITYESIRNYAVEADTQEKCINNVKQQSSKYFPTLENIRFFLFGAVTGISAYMYITKMNDGQ